MTGTAPPTAASNRSGLPQLRASETSSWPCSAITCLFAVTTARPARRAAAIHARGGVVFLTGGTGLYIRAFRDGLIEDGEGGFGDFRADAVAG